MAKIRYKIGTFVKVAEDEDVAPHYGAVEEVRLTTDGVAYKVSGLDDTVEETEIVESYRRILPRKTAKAATSTKKSKKSRAYSSEAHEAA